MLLGMNYSAIKTYSIKLVALVQWIKHRLSLGLRDCGFDPHTNLSGFLLFIINVQLDIFNSWLFLIETSIMMPNISKSCS